MTKFSDFIRAPGTAGPPTRDGIRTLGFALQSDFPVELEKYLWLGGAQTFTGGEKTQGRANLGVVIGTDVQAFSASLASIAGLTTAADRLAYTTAADTWAVTTLTAFARTILDDTNASGVRTTIGLGNVDNTSDAAKPISTATQTALDLKAPLASPTFTGVPAVPTAAPGTNTTQAASTAFVTAAVALPAATQAQQEAASSNVVAVTPGNQKFHPSAAKAHGYVTQTGGTYTLQADSFGISSISKNATGDVRVNFSTAFSSTRYTVLLTLGDTTINFLSVNKATKSTGFCDVTVRTAAGTAADIDFSIAVFGDQ